MECPRCNAKMVKNGTRMSRTGRKQGYLCMECGTVKYALIEA